MYCVVFHVQLLHAHETAPLTPAKHTCTYIPTGRHDKLHDRCLSNILDVALSSGRTQAALAFCLGRSVRLTFDNH